MGFILGLPFKIVFWSLRKIVIGIPLMVGKSILMALLMALLPIIVVIAVIWWLVSQI